MDIKREVAACLYHLIEHQIDFRALFQARLVPFAVKVHANRIGPQMPARGTIWIHVGHDIEHRFFEQVARIGTDRIENPFQEPFHPPLGHGLARVLARGNPKRALISPWRSDLQ